VNRFAVLAALALSSSALASDPVWIRGDTYKASFGAEGATYIPFLGSRAPKDYPVRLRVERVSVGGDAVAFDGAAEPRPGEDRFEFDRGTFVESYLVRPDQLEQTFRFDRIDRAGDLELSIAVESELAASESVARIELSGESGAVRYGKATVVDAAGRSASAPTSVAADGIRIRVPAEFLATARFPVTIDPVISTFTIDGSTADDSVPDVAYDASNDRYLAVYEEAFSATDHDIRVKLLNSTGGVITSGFVDSTTADWIAPRVANHNGSNQFLVVAQVTSTLAVVGKTVAASTLAMSGVITIGNGFNQDVGGTSSTSSTSDYLVVWTTTIEGIGNVLEQRLVSTSGVPAGSGATILTFGNTGGARISKSNRGFDWNVVYPKSGIACMRIHSDGSVTTPEFFVSNASGVEHPSASSCLDSTSRYLVAWAQNTGTNRDIEVALVDDATVLDTADLSTIEGDSALGDQFDPSTDTDGASFAVAYTEFIGFPTANDSTYVATLTPVGTQLHLSEGHRTLSAATVDEDHTSVTGTRGTGGAAARFMAVWDVANGGTAHGDIEGGLLDAEEFTPFCVPGADGVVACPCSNPPGASDEGCNNSSGTGGARLTKSGTASLANDTLVFTTSGERATAFTVLFQGTAALQNGAINGQGVRCVGGTLKRLYKKNASAGSITTPSGSDPSVSAKSAAVGAPIASGATRYYYVAYRDPAVLGSCPATSTINLSQAGAVIWRP
jgi:hypothetical protein